MSMYDAPNYTLIIKGSLEGCVFCNISSGYLGKCVNYIKSTLECYKILKIYR